MRRLSTALFLIALFSSHAVATPVLYTNASDPAWSGAISGLSATTIDFNGLLGGGPSAIYTGPAWLVEDGITFKAGGTPGYADLWVRRGSGQDYGWGSGELISGPNGSWANGYIEILLPAGLGVTAVAFDTGAVQEAVSRGGPVSVKVNLNGVGSPVNTGNSWAFVGITSATEITSVRIATSDSKYPLLDNFVFYTGGAGDPLGGGDPPPGGGDPPPSSDTPEADSWILAVSGVALMTMGARAHRRVRPTR